MDNLTAEQSRALQELLVSEVVRKNSAWCDLPCLRRYLTASGWKADKAKKMLASTLEWREKTKPETYKTSDFPDVCLKGRYMYWNGYDQHGHPILYVHSQLHDCGLDREQRIRFSIFILEKGITLMSKKNSGKEGVEQWSIVVDETGRTRKNNDLSFLRKIGPIMFSHYVERLYRIYIVRPTSTFSALYKVCSLFMDDVTKGKVRLSPLDQEAMVKADIKDPEKVLEGDEAVAVTSPLSLSSPPPVGDLQTAFPELLADLGQPNLQVSWGGKTPDIVDFPAYYMSLQSTTS